MNNSIAFFQPSDCLYNYVQNYYIGEFSAKPGTDGFEQRHLANGCVELFISYDNTRSTCIDHQGEKFMTDSGIVGAHSLDNSFRGIAIESGCNKLKFIAVNFRQNGFYDIFKIPASELYNSFFASVDLLGNEIKALQDRLNNAKNSVERVRCVEEYLYNCLVKNSHRDYNLGRGTAIFSCINERKGNVRLDELRKMLCVSERTLQREFKSAYGFPIKEYCRISRFFNLLGHMTNSQKTDWPDLVVHFGYYDQPHMINEFRAATGTTPSAYKRDLNKTLFRLYNHLVSVKNAGNSNDVSEAMTQGTVSSAKAEGKNYF